jgi:hypothetical protein
MRPLFWPQCNFGSARRSLSRSSRMPDMFRTRASAGLGLCQKSTDYETRSLRSMQRGIRTQAMLHRKRLKDQGPGSCTPSDDCEGIPVLTTVLAVRLWFVGCRDTGSFALSQLVALQDGKINASSPGLEGLLVSLAPHLEVQYLPIPSLTYFDHQGNKWYTNSLETEVL